MNLRTATILVFFTTIFLVVDLLSQDGPPAELVSAMQAYEREFLRDVSPIQQKYIRALNQYQRNFTRAANLKGAEEARKEAKLANLWKTIPFHVGRRTLATPELNSLLKNYENAIAKVTAPIAERHIEALESLKVSLSKSGNLDAALMVEQEMELVHSGESFPAEAGLRQAHERFSRDDFEKWLLDQTVEFTGKTAGRTILKFDGKNLSYESSRTVSYPYKVDTLRSVDIDSGRFRIEFSKDLMSGTFESNRGIYELRFVPEEDETSLNP